MINVTASVVGLQEFQRRGMNICIGFYVYRCPGPLAAEFSWDGVRRKRLVVEAVVLGGRIETEVAGAQ